MIIEGETYQTFFVDADKSFSKESFKYANRYDPDIIYVSTPPNFLFKYASKYKKRHKSVKIIFEIGDMWPETLPISDNIKTIISPALFIWKFESE